LREFPHFSEQTPTVCVINNRQGGISSKGELLASRFGQQSGLRGEPVLILRFRHWKWIPAFAGMTMPGTGAVNIVLPAEAGIHFPRSG
jgi:hypothetical protein